MKIFSASQQKLLDQQTIDSQKISSLELMERASLAFFKAFKREVDKEKSIDIYCGSGNNGGDGLAVARLLFQDGYDVRVFRVESEKYSKDNESNMNRLLAILPKQALIKDLKVLKTDETSLAVDALFGTGLSQPIAGEFADIIDFINTNYSEIIALDIPSGLFCDTPNNDQDKIISCHKCFTFNAPKLSFLLPSSGALVPSWEVVDIGIPEFLKEQIDTAYQYIDHPFIENLTPKRSKFSHKGSFGYGLLWAGSYGMYGAAILASRAAMKAGIGKLSVYSSEQGHDILQVANPEVMFSNEEDIIHRKGFNAIGIGPGLGKHPDFNFYFTQLLENYGNLPWVIDADALNLLSTNTEWLKKLPNKSILTPHPKEFERLIGKKWKDSFERQDFLKAFAKEINCIVVLKGAHTAIATPNGEVYFNSTGNPKMATAGSGDVLTGIILGLLGQKLSSLQAAIYGVYLHGKAGDTASKNQQSHSLLASDIINEI